MYSYVCNNKQHQQDLAGQPHGQKTKVKCLHVCLECSVSWIQTHIVWWGEHFLCCTVPVRDVPLQKQPVTAHQNNSFSFPGSTGREPGNEANMCLNKDPTITALQYQLTSSWLPTRYHHNELTRKWGPGQLALWLHRPISFTLECERKENYRVKQALVQ